MDTRVEYQFDDEPTAYRFLNTVSGWGKSNLTVKYGRSSFHVTVRFQVAVNTFDTTLSDLDDLASKHNGKEVN